MAGVKKILGNDQASYTPATAPSGDAASDGIAVTDLEPVQPAVVRSPRQLAIDRAARLYRHAYDSWLIWRGAAICPWEQEQGLILANARVGQTSSATVTATAASRRQRVAGSARGRQLRGTASSVRSCRPGPLHSVVLADRFSLRGPVVHGGMSSIHRAFDAATGRWVALKLLELGGLTRRFLREGAVLAELRHEAIVEYVAHGVSSTGDAWLATEWLEGETLRARLERRALTVAETLAVARRLAAALACAHARDVGHRDVKPSNIFLPHGDPALAKLLGPWHAQC